MTTAEREECLENLEFLGVLDVLSKSATSASAETFSFDKPSFSTFPIILHALFRQIDEKECNRRFKDCWPLDNKFAITKFRQVSVAWVQEIKKNDRTGAYLDLSHQLFDNPFGERFVKFLLGFSTHVLYVIAQRYDDNESTSINETTSENEKLQLPRLPSVTDPTEADVEALAELYRSEAEMMKEYLAEMTEKIELAEQQLANAQEEEQRERERLRERLNGLADQLKCPQAQIDDADLLRIAEELTGKAVTSLQKYKADFDQLKPLFEHARQFKETCTSSIFEKPVFRGVDVADDMKSGPLRDVFLADGRLDVGRLVNKLQASVDALLDHARAAGSKQELSLLQDQCSKLHAVLTVALDEQNVPRDALNASVTAAESSIASMRSEIVEKYGTLPSRPLPEWIRLPPAYTAKPTPIVDLDQLLKPSTIDWNQICAQAASISLDDIPDDATDSSGSA